MKKKDIAGLLHHALIPAVPVPFTNERTIHRESHIRMTEYMNDMPIGGVAVWAHTGRGIYLSVEERGEVLTHWRESLPHKVLIAGANSRAMAEHAAHLEADAILCHPPSQLRMLPSGERDRAVIAYHHDLAKAGLPLILFYLYESAGGISYSIDILRQLFSIPNVIGIKIATLDSVMTFQNLAATIKSEFSDKLLITGEDRFLGYSLMMGVDAALVGMGTALTALQYDMMRAYYKNEVNDFLYRSSAVDRFSMVTFTEPMEGYIARMLYALSWLGIVSPEATFDPWGLGLTDADKDSIGNFLTSLPSHLKL
ncbi:MAG TPA: dihydrodipicolinate synthase family protein [Candidatus Kapabacteria bacterium]|jgi:4-hydroxy-tetrahydrodipicolinate synthase